MRRCPRVNSAPSERCNALVMLRRSLGQLDMKSPLQTLSLFKQMQELPPYFLPVTGIEGHRCNVPRRCWTRCQYYNKRPLCLRTRWDRYPSPTNLMNGVFPMLYLSITHRRQQIRISQLLRFGSRGRIRTRMLLQLRPFRWV